MNAPAVSETTHRDGLLSSSAPAERYSRDPHSTVWRLSADRLAGVGALECAFSFPLPAVQIAWVDLIQARLTGVDGALMPHATLLHLGVQSAADLLALPAEVVDLLPVEVWFSEIGVFELSNGGFNLHIRLVPADALRQMQHHLTEACAPVLNRGSFSPYCGPAFIPHVTILSRAEDRCVLDRLVADNPPPAAPFRLDGLHLIGDMKTAHDL